MCSLPPLPSLLGDIEKPLEPEEDVSELGDEAICVMADMAVRLEDMPDMEPMLDMGGMFIPMLDIVGNMAEPDRIVILGIYNCSHFG